MRRLLARVGSARGAAAWRPSSVPASRGSFSCLPARPAGAWARRRDTLGVAYPLPHARMLCDLSPGLREVPSKEKAEADEEWFADLQGEKPRDILAEIQNEKDHTVKSAIVEEALVKLHEVEQYAIEWLEKGGIPPDYMKLEEPTLKQVEQMVELSSWQGVDSDEKRTERDEEHADYIEREKQSLKDYANAAKERMEYVFTYKRKLLGDMHPTTMQSGMLLAKLLMQQRHLDQAEELVKGFAMRVVAQLLQERASVEEEQRRKGEEIVDVVTVLQGFNPFDYRAMATHMLADILVQTGRIDDAIRLCTNAAKSMAGEFQRSPSMSHVLFMRGMANSLIAGEKMDEAEEVLTLSMELYDKVRSADKRSGKKKEGQAAKTPREEKASCIVELAKLKLMRGSVQEAISLFEEAIQIFEKEGGPFSLPVLTTKAEMLSAMAFCNPYDVVKEKLMTLLDDTEQAEELSRKQRVQIGEEKEEDVRKSTGVYLHFLQKGVQLTSAFEDPEGTIMLLKKVVKEHNRAMEMAAPNTELVLTCMTLAKAHMEREDHAEVVKGMDEVEPIIIRSFGNPSAVLGESYYLKGEAMLRQLPFYEGAFVTTLSAVPQELTGAQRALLGDALVCFSNSADVYTRFNNNSPDSLAASSQLQAATVLLCQGKKEECFQKTEDALWTLCESIAKRVPCEEDIVLGEKIFADMEHEERVDFSRAAAWHGQNLALSGKQEEGALWLRFTRAGLSTPIDMSVIDKEEPIDEEEAAKLALIPAEALEQAKDSPQRSQLQVHLHQIECVRLMWLSYVCEQLADYYTTKGDADSAGTLSRQAQRTSDELKKASEIYAAIRENQKH